MLKTVFDRFQKHSPVSVIARAVFEFGMSADEVDRVFREHAVEQRECELLFSSIVDVLGQAVTGSRKSVHEAYRHAEEEFQVTVKSMYDKMALAEPVVARALVRNTAARLAPLIDELGATAEPLVPGYHAKILDGKHLNGTEHRLKETRHLRAAPLPGQWLVVLDPQRRLVLDAIPGEDGHAQERTLLDQILPTVEEDDLWIADANFCTTSFFFGIVRQGGSLLIRQHGSTLHGKRLKGSRREKGRCEKGTVYEQAMEIDDPDSGETLVLRRITIELDKPTRNGATEIHLLSNLPEQAADAVTLAEIYRQRWMVENAFQELGQSLNAEINTLTYPRAALLAYAIALMTYNVISVVKASLRSVHGEEAAPERLSGYYLASEIKSVYGGMAVAIPEEQWRKRFGSLDVPAMAALLRTCAAHVRLPCYLKTTRGPKKRPPPRRSGQQEKHVSTHRLLAARAPSRGKNF